MSRRGRQAPSILLSAGVYIVHFKKEVGSGSGLFIILLSAGVYIVQFKNKVRSGAGLNIKNIKIKNPYKFKRSSQISIDQG